MVFSSPPLVQVFLGVSDVVHGVPHRLDDLLLTKDGIGLDLATKGDILVLDLDLHGEACVRILLDVFV